MPSMLDDPTAPVIYRTSGAPPYPEPYGLLPPDIMARQVTLRDRVTMATLVPFSSPHQVPHQLAAYLCELLNGEIEKGDTYPMMEPIPLSSFTPYWFANFGAVMVLGDLQSTEEVTQMEEQGVDWAKQCLGSFYIKPNYPGRSSHVCNGGFLVTDAARNRGVGRLMGEGYLEWAPKLGYTYSVFNLVYETNVASLRIWDALGFKRIGRVKGCGNLKSYPEQYIDAIIFGRELGGEGDDYVSEERFDKIRFYLKTGTYPNGSDRAEKSRLRSAATHYRLIPNTSGDGEEEKLMLKGKEVISDPHKQYEIARNMHAGAHGGINKTTASIAEKYHWVRIKDTVSAAIRNCPECKDSASKTPVSYNSRRSISDHPAGGASSIIRPARNAETNDSLPEGGSARHQQNTPSRSPRTAPPPTAQMANSMQQYSSNVPSDYSDVPVDPQIMQGIQHWQSPSAAGGAQPMSIDGPGHSASSNHLHGGAISSNHNNNEQENTTMDDEVDTRLREELEAQIMHEQSAYGGQLRDRTR